MAAEPVEGPLSRAVHRTERPRRRDDDVPDRLDVPTVCRNPITDHPATISRRYPSTELCVTNQELYSEV